MKKLALLATLGSLAMLLGAFAFQHIGGMAPCKLCIWQRWPHGIAIALGVLIYLIPNRWIALLGGLVVLGGAAIAFYHAGVELQFWPGPDTCTSGDISKLSAEALMAQILATPVVRCDEVPWSLFGISMAGWNGIISLGIGGIWLLAFRAGRRRS